MKYFELFLTKETGEIPSDDEDMASICVKAVRPPVSPKEATGWIKTDLTGKTRVYDLREISEDEVREDFEVTEKDGYPVFGAPAVHSLPC